MSDARIGPDTNSCGTCGFWVVDPNDSTLGECRAHPPAPQTHTGDLSAAGVTWATTKTTDWCGEWQVRS
jgi:hypothetical protein